MTDPHDTLAVFAEVATALAGFSGIVIAFGRRSAGSLSRLEIRRLSNLFTGSGTTLVLALLGVSLLHVGFEDADRIWIWGSAIAFVLMAPWLIRDVVLVRRLEAAEKAQVNLLLVFVIDSLAVAMLLLQLANVFLIQQQWPFFLALVLVIAAAFQQFILLVRTGIRDGSVGGS